MGIVIVLAKGESVFMRASRGKNPWMICDAIKIELLQNCSTRWTTKPFGRWILATEPEPDPSLVEKKRSWEGGGMLRAFSEVTVRATPCCFQACLGWLHLKLERGRYCVLLIATKGKRSRTNDAISLILPLGLLTPGALLLRDRVSKRSSLSVSSYS